MKYTLHQNLSERTGVISNLHGFLNRHLDTGFKSKWSGYWVPPYKFLDYYAFKVNGVWLDGSTVEATEYGEEMVFHHETGSLHIIERVSTPEDLPGIRVELEIENKQSSKKAIHAVLEPGIDIRHKSEDISHEDYSIEVDEDRIIASRKGKKLLVDSEQITGFEGESYRKEHFPEEKQECLVPERPVFREELEAKEKKKFRVEFKTSEGFFGKIGKKKQKLEHPLGRSFSSSIDSLRNLTYGRNGKGVIAGHPWFQSYWARDTFWSLLGYIDAGYFDLSREILENFAENLQGKINLEEVEEEEFKRDDTSPLFIIAADKLRRHDSISPEIEEAMDRAMNELELDEELVDHDPCGTWTDTIERQQAVDIQSLWLEAAEIMGDERKERLRSGLERFEKDGKMVDCLEDSCGTVNHVIPVMFGQVDQELAEEQLEHLNGEFSSRYGARTRSVTDPGYDSSGYHTGSVWGLTTCWTAGANFEYGNFRQGKNMLEKLDSMLDRDQPGALPEVVDAESGELLGCPEQAWSAGLFVHIIDSYMLGIRAVDEGVKIDPAGDVSCVRKGKRIKGEKLDLRFDNGDVKIMNEPDIEVET